MRNRCLKYHLSPLGARNSVKRCRNTAFLRKVELHAEPEFETSFSFKVPPMVNGQFKRGIQAGVGLIQGVKNKIQVQRHAIRITNGRFLSMDYEFLKNREAACWAAFYHLGAAPQSLRRIMWLHTSSYDV